jgi:hypothetical protein
MDGETMRGKNSSGGSAIEMCFVFLVLFPLFYGTGAIGVNLVRTLQTIQLARDLGHMYARGIDFSQSANQTVMYQLGSSLGLTSSSSTSNAVVILSNLIYVDSGQCLAANAWTNPSTPVGPTGIACTNYQKWVFTQRLEFGNTNLRSSNLGNPLSSIVNSTTGQITQTNYVTNAGAVANFSAINPYSNTSGVISGLPSGQTLYASEVGAQAWAWMYFQNQSTYSFDLF